MTFRIRHSAPLIGDAEIDAVTRVIRSGQLAQGREVEAFEQECAALVGRRYGVAVSSGTAALHVALLVLVPGKRVALPSYGCASLMTATHLAHAEPVLCDIAEDFNIDAHTVPAAADAVIVPHLFGRTARIPDHEWVVEDIAQSIGGTTGRNGAVTIASFYATKLITTGEGGMVLTDDGALAGVIRDRRDYDHRGEFRVRFNYKMTDMQAAMGRAQLKRLPGFIERRREIAARYEAAFQSLPITLPVGDDHVFFRYVVRTNERGALERHLRGCGIEAKRPVYLPAHHYAPANCPQSQRAHEVALSIPIHPAMTGDDMTYLIACVIRYFNKNGG